MSNVIAIATWDHTLALKSDKTVVAWGNNAYGQTNLPAGLDNTVISVAGSYYESAALKGNGTVLIWGLTNSLIPTGLTTAVAVSVGSTHALALRADGTHFVESSAIWFWESWLAGQLGAAFGQT